MAGFFNGLLRKPAETSRIVYDFVVKKNLFERSNFVNLHGAALVRNNFCQGKNISRSKTALVLARIEF